MFRQQEREEMSISDNEKHDSAGKSSNSPRHVLIVSVVSAAVVALCAYSFAWCALSVDGYRTSSGSSSNVVSNGFDSGSENSFRSALSDAFCVRSAYASTDGTSASGNSNDGDDVSAVVGDGASSMSDSVEGDDDQERGSVSGYETRQGMVSQLNDESRNPYHNDYRVTVDVGSEFATFGSLKGSKQSSYTEGYLVKVAPGGTITLPTDISAREGYYFVGWSTGGVPEKPTWGVDTREIVVDESPNDSRNITLYALYADDNGDGWCTCGAWKQGVYKDSLDEIKSAYKDYIASSPKHAGVKASADGNYEQSTSPIADIVICVLLLAAVLFVVFDRFVLRDKMRTI